MKKKEWKKLSRTIIQFLADDTPDWDNFPSVEFDVIRKEYNELLYKAIHTNRLICEADMALNFLRRAKQKENE